MPLFLDFTSVYSLKTLVRHSEKVLLWAQKPQHVGIEAFLCAAGRCEGADHRSVVGVQQ